MLKTGLFIWRGLDIKFETIEDDIGQMRSPSWVRTRPASSALALASWHSPAQPSQPSVSRSCHTSGHRYFHLLLLKHDCYSPRAVFQSFVYLSIISRSFISWYCTFFSVKYNIEGKIRFENDIETRSFTFETLQSLFLTGDHDCNQFRDLKYLIKMWIMSIFSLWMNSCLVTPTIIAIVTTQFTTTSQLHSVERKLTTAPGHPSVGENIMCNLYLLHNIKLFQCQKKSWRTEMTSIQLLAMR